MVYHFNSLSNMALKIRALFVMHVLSTSAFSQLENHYVNLAMRYIECISFCPYNTSSRDDKSSRLAQAFNQTELPILALLSGMALLFQYLNLSPPALVPMSVSPDHPPLVLKIYSNSSQPT